MNIIGIGTDIVDIRRIEKIMQKNPLFISKILTPTEIHHAKDKINNPNYIAKRWSAKEACVKASDKKLLFKEIEIFNNENGKPELLLPFPYKGYISLSDEWPYAIAYVMIFSEN